MCLRRSTEAPCDLCRRNYSQTITQFDSMGSHCILCSQNTHTHYKVITISMVCYYIHLRNWLYVYVYLVFVPLGHTLPLNFSPSKYSVLTELQKYFVNNYCSSSQLVAPDTHTTGPNFTLPNTNYAHKTSQVISVKHF
jgi:hypothetical protein